MISAGKRWDAAAYADDAAFVSALGAPVIDLLAPRSGELILDLGCGDGALTHALLEKAARPIGVDSSIDMVQACRQRGISAVVADGQALCFRPVFDAVFTNAALHWMPDLEAKIAGVAGILKPRGRFVGEMGGIGNVATVVAALRGALVNRGIDFDAINPWTFPAPDDFRNLLGGHGFEDIAISLIDRPTEVDAGPRAWLQIFAGGILHQVVAEGREALLDEVADRLLAGSLDSRGPWIADYVRLRFSARLAR